jgi:hypothetical protein
LSTRRTRISLKKYIEQKNKYAVFFKQDALNLKTLTNEQVQELADKLDCDLSPENLCCDGELRGAKLRAKSNMLYGARGELNALAEQRGITLLDPLREFM